MIGTLTNSPALANRVTNPESDADGQNKKLLSACREFEAVFYQQILKQMRSTIVKSDWLNGGNGEDAFRDLLDGEYAKLMAEKSNTGLADMIYRQLSKD